MYQSNTENPFNFIIDNAISRIEVSQKRFIQFENIENSHIGAYEYIVLRQAPWRLWITPINGHQVTREIQPNIGSEPHVPREIQLLWGTEHQDTREVQPLRGSEPHVA